MIGSSGYVMFFMKHLSFSPFNIRKWCLGLDRSIEETLKTLDKLVVSPEELAHWCDVLESAARDNCKIMRLKFNYCPDKKSIEFIVEDTKSRDCLVKSIETNLPLIPESLQGFFSVFKYDLKNMKFDG